MQTSKDQSERLFASLSSTLRKLCDESPDFGSFGFKAEVCDKKLARVVVTIEESKKIEKNQIGGGQ